MNLEQQYSLSLEQPETFWTAAADELAWDHKPEIVLDSSNAPFYRWFVGGRLNTAYNCLDRHVRDGFGEQLALIYDSAMTGEVQRITYAELTSRVARFAGALANQGVRQGDRVVIYMPMVPEAVIAMLGCARLGAIHSVVFGGFAAAELATRIDDAEPKVIVSASCGLEPNKVVAYKPLLDAALAQSRHQPDRCLIFQRPQCQAGLQPGRDLSFSEALRDASPHSVVSVEATDPLYILYTSGTTGKPKGVVRDHGGHATALKWSMKAVYGVKPGSVYWAASDLGWVVGHSYIVYAPLLNRCTTVLYEGKPVDTPDAGAFWRVIQDHGVSSLFTAPTSIRAIKGHDPEGREIAKYDLSTLESVFLAGERCDPDSLEWAASRLKVPVIDHWWQTETGWAMVANPLGIEPLPVKPGSATKPVPGWDLRVLDEAGQPVARGEIGNLAVKLPLPPGSLLGLWHADERFVESYLSRFEGYYATADAGYIDDDGYVYVVARIDDVINVAGHRLSTSALEEAVAAHKDVAECAVIGVRSEVKGQLPFGMIVLNRGCSTASAQVVRECIANVRDNIGPVAAFKNAVVVDRLPKTRSGKVLRGTLRKIADRQDWSMPATIEEPEVLRQLETVILSLEL